MKMLRISEVSEMTGLATSHIRLLHKNGKLIPDRVTEGGTRYYLEETVKEFLGFKPTKTQRKIIGYCRVSSKKQSQDLDRQVERMETYMLAKGYSFEIITDIGSGINYEKRGLRELIRRIDKNEVDKVVIMYKDRLIRFGYELLEYMCDLHSTEIEVIDTTDKTEQDELTEDLVQIITVFACRLQGKRARKTKELIKELTSNADEESDVASD